MSTAKSRAAQTGIVAGRCHPKIVPDEASEISTISQATKRAALRIETIGIMKPASTRVP